MIERTLAKRYAAALLRVTDADGSTEDTEAFLLALREAWQRDPALRTMLAHPRVPRAVKKRVLSRAFEGRAHKSFIDFLSLLVDKNRLAILPELAELFDRLADATRGVVRVRVRSWKPLSDAHRSRLSEKLGKMTGKKILVEAETDAALQGGMLVHVGDSVIDGSVAHRLKTIGERLREFERR